MTMHNNCPADCPYAGTAACCFCEPPDDDDDADQ